MAGDKITKSRRNKTNVHIVGQVTLFNTELLGGYDHASGCLVVRHLNAGKENKGISVAQIADQIADMIEKLAGEKSSVSLEIPWPEGAKEIADGMQVYLKEVYLKATTEEPKSVEYALWIGIESTDQLKEQFPITLDELYLKVWNTTNEQVLEEMNISQIQNLLERGGVDRKQVPPAESSAATEK